MTGIISYGTYIPRNRLKTIETAQAWGKQSKEIEMSLGISEKSVAANDEDAVTMAIESTTQSLHLFAGKPTDIEAIFVGSESHPYAVNPTATIIGQYLGVGNNYLASDLEFACKAGTAGMQAIAGLVDSKQIKCGLAIGTDAAQSKPHDALEYASASAAVSLLLGDPSYFSTIATLVDYTSYSSDTPDFWRRDGIRYPSHAGRFTGEPAYFAHVTGSANALLKKTGINPSEITYCVFHMPNGKFPRQAAKRLGFEEKGLAPSLTVDFIGNPYSASSMLGLAATLDIAKPGDKIFMVSYGSGAGSDSFLFEVTEEIKRMKDKEMVAQQIENKKYISYIEYLKMTHKL